MNTIYEEGFKDAESLAILQASVRSDRLAIRDQTHGGPLYALNYEHLGKKEQTIKNLQRKAQLMTTDWLLTEGGGI